MSQLESVDDAKFADALAAGGVMAVDFWAPWCPPCRLTTPILEELAVEYEGRIRIRALDTDLNPATAARFGIRGLPTVIFFRGGEEVARVVGAVPKPQLRKKLEEVVEAVASPGG